MKKIKIIITILLLCICVNGFSQDERFMALEKSLQTLVTTNPGLEEKVELSVDGVSLQEFIYGIAKTHSLNISVDQTINGMVYNNFSNAKVIDVLLFLCRQYNMDIKIIGSIMSFSKYVEPVKKPDPVVVRKPKVNYNDQNGFLSLELKSDTLDRVAEEITRTSMYNVILSPEVKGKTISVFIQNRPIDNALEKMALSNGLKVTKTADNFYYIQKDEATVKNPDQKHRNNGSNGGNLSNNSAQNGSLLLELNGKIITKISAGNTPITDIIQSVSKDMFINYFLYNEIQGNTSFYAENITFDQLLDYVFNGSSYTYKKQDDVYLMGDRKLEGLRSTELITLKNRTIESVIDFIPAPLKQDIEIKEFKDLNGLIVIASRPRINEIKEFLIQVDQIVPVVTCEIIIVDVNDSKVVSTGISMGLGNAPTNTSGTITPGVDLSLNSGSINNLISGLNGFGLINLGNVTPDFYLKIQALEDDGYLKKRSTPQISTLNGNEASMKIGKTEYYLEVNNNLVSTGNNNQNILQTQVYKSVNADLNIKVKPFVSSDGQITMTVTVEESDFTGKISTTAPPGTFTRHFESTIRVKSEQMILLGGLEGDKKNETVSGLPFISRIPVLKWFFSKRIKEKSKTRLNVFIRPRVIY